MKDASSLRRWLLEKYPDHHTKGGSYEKCKDCGHKFEGKSICALIACKFDLWPHEFKGGGPPSAQLEDGQEKETAQGG